MSRHGIGRIGLLSSALVVAALATAGARDAADPAEPHPAAALGTAGTGDSGDRIGSSSDEADSRELPTTEADPADLRGPGAEGSSDGGDAARAAVPAPTSPARLAAAPPIQVDTPTVVTETAVEERPRSRWRRSRNRYPGPIPTPEEWEPPEGPVKIALQAGHWRASEAPPELYGIRANGTRWEETLEWQANLEIAQRAGEMLEELGYAVEVLPAVVPPGYRAHLFISIHADGSPDPNASGYRVASPRRDATGRAARAASLLDEAYGEATGIKRLPTVTRRMQSYYAFNFRRYEHALHPMTIGVILETGFLTNAADREIILGDPERAARGIVSAVMKFEETPPPRLAADSP